MSNAIQTPQAAAPLQVATMEEIKRDLGTSATAAPAAAAVDPELDAKADQFVAALLAIDPKDFAARKDYASAAESMGIELQKQAAKKSEILKQQIGKIAADEGDGGEVAKSLVDLKMQVEELDPARLDLDPGWFSRMLGQIPGVGTPLKRYFTKFESAQTVIAAIVRSLETGRDQLGRDNVNLVEDQKGMYELTGKLDKAIRLAQRIDQKLDSKLKEMTSGSEQHKFVAEELLFPLRQRIIDLQQQLAVNQQGVLVTEGIIRNNKELVRGVNRTLHVTVSALNVGATLAIALANQKSVLEKVESVNKTTGDLIAGTAERLKTQGAQIHKQASSSMIEIDQLKQSFADIKAAMDDIATFRMNALPQMAQSVVELDRITTEAAAQIEKMNRGNLMRPGVTIDVQRGLAMPRPSLPGVLLERIRCAYEGGVIVRRIAAEFGVSTRTIERHARALSWRRMHDNRRVDPQLMARCHTLYCEAALPVTEIERRTRVARATIHRWIRQYRWRA